MSDAPSPTFLELYGAPPSVRATAPGRVNVIGEHTDYNGGFVLPAAIPQHTTVELRPRSGAAVEVWSRNVGPGGERNAYTLGMETRQRDWLDYVRGLTWVLRSEGHTIPGFQLRIESDVPVGSGLSSSAALEISVLRAIRAAFALPLDDIALARAGQRAETDFVGAPVGIMDQMACSLADETHVLFLDTRTLVHERIALPTSAQLVVIDSGISHRHADGGYRTRRAECDRAASLLQIVQLRDIHTAGLDRVASLPPPLDRRARHVVTENARVLATVAALRAGDLHATGALLHASHASMRDDFEISTPEIDLLVAIATERAEVYGARLTGGGFGGAIVALARRDSAEQAARAIAEKYASRTGRRATVLVPQSRHEPG